MPEIGIVSAAEREGQPTALDHLRGILELPTEEGRVEAFERWQKMWLQVAHLEQHFPADAAEMLGERAAKVRYAGDEGAAGSLAKNLALYGEITLLEDRGLQTVRVEPGSEKQTLAYVSHITIMAIRQTPAAGT